MAKKKSSDLMKLTMTLAILAALPVSVMAFNTFRYGFPQARLTDSQVPNGQYYEMILTGVPTGKQAQARNGSEYHLYVSLEGRTQINLKEGVYRVVDANGTDGRAEFQLPNPDPDGDGATDYVVWVKISGNRDGSFTTNPCATDDVTGDLYCSIKQVVTVREGARNLVDVNRDLMYVYFDLDGGGKTQRYQLFSDNLEGYLWEYDGQGQNRAQLRFYEIPSPDINN
jgi:hypothetical protein